MRKVHTKSTLSDSIFSLQHKDSPSPHAPAREERRGDRFKSSATALDSLRMPLPFGTPCYFKNIRGNLIYCSALSSGWQESPQGNTKLGNRSGGGREGWVGGGDKGPCPFLHPPPWWIGKNGSVMFHWRQVAAPAPLIFEWLLWSHEIAWNPFPHLWPANAVRYL